MNRQLRRHPLRQPAKAQTGSQRLPRLAPQAARPSRGIRGIFKPYWLQDILSELRKVTWPTRREAWNLTVVVIVFSVVVGLALGAIDLGFSWILERILL